MSTPLTSVTSDRSEADSVIAITMAAEAGKLRQVDLTKRYSVVVPDGYNHRVVDLTHLLPYPQRARGRVELQTVADFANYVERHDDPATTTVWVDMDAGTIQAVIDDHAGPAHGEAAHDEAFPGWGEHRAALGLTPTDEWRHWINSNARWMTQEAFAEHIEAAEQDIVEPEYAELIEIVQTLQGKTNADWKSGIRLHDGRVQLQYVEEATATAGGKGELEIPKSFKLGLAPFLGEDPWTVEARLRFRIKENKVSLAYKLNRAEDVRRQAIDEIATRLSHRFPRRVFIGVPRS